MRDICEHRSASTGAVSIINPEKIDVSEDGPANAEIEKFAADGIRDTGIGVSQQLLLRRGYTVGYPTRFARLMKEDESLGRGQACRVKPQNRFEGRETWTNLEFETLEVSRSGSGLGGLILPMFVSRDVSSMSALLMDVFTRIIKAWQISSALEYNL